MHEEPGMPLMDIDVEVIDALGIEKGGTPLYAMDHISPVQKKLGQIRAILSGNTGDQGNTRVRRMLDDGCWMLNAGCSPPDVGC